jgi:hypothetical protein
MHRALAPHRFPGFAGDSQPFSPSGCLLRRRPPTDTTAVTNHTIRNIIDNYATATTRNHSASRRESDYSARRPPSSHLTGTGRATFSFLHARVGLSWVSFKPVVNRFTDSSDA